ncbi:EAL domain-containing protein, partial [Escherichia coli]|nr:EAL domain-containing protein [Escherichia coli]
GLKTNVVAEGVEDSNQAQLLRSLGCNQVQGFYYSRPMPLEEWPTHLVNMK